MRPIVADGVAILLNPAVAAAAPHDEYQRHLPIIEPLVRLIHRGQHSGEFDRGQSPTWLVAAAIALGHAAGQEVSAGRMSIQDAGAVFRDSVLRVYGARGVDGPAANRSNQSR